MISVLCPVRPNSEYMEHFLIGFFASVHTVEDVELVMLLNEKDEWNRRAVKYFGDKVKFLFEGTTQGRSSLHGFYSTMLEHAKGDWIMLVCEDFDFKTEHWDNATIRVCQSKHGLDPSKVYVMLPRVKVPGNVCHVLSRGYVEAVGGVLSEHCAVDSWLNSVLDELPEDRKFVPEDLEILDYTHTAPKKRASLGEPPGAQPTAFHEDTKALEALRVQVDKLKARIEQGG